MPKDSIIQLPFERTLNFKKDGKSFSGVLRVLSIQQTSEKKWTCRWSLDFLCQNGAVHGDDPLHALTNCLFVASRLIRESGKDGVQVFWQYQGDYGGLPAYE